VGADVVRSIDYVVDHTVDYIARVIAHRAPELSEADLARLAESAAPAAPQPVMLPPEIGERIFDVLVDFERRLTAVERWLGVGGRA
jgi:hypothetical protein